MPAAFDHNFAKRLNGTHIKNAATRWDMVEQLREDIRNFKAANNCDRIAVLWAASTEIYVPLSERTQVACRFGKGYEGKQYRSCFSEYVLRLCRNSRRCSVHYGCS